jgi:cation transport ATPase
VIGTEGLQQVQKDTLYLTDKKYRNMKNTMKLSGVAGMALMAFGALFKIQHYTGSAVLITLGFVLMIAVFFPISMMVMRKESSQLKRPIIYLSALTGGIAVMMAVLLKVMHWPGANVMFIAGYGLTGIVFLPFFVSKLIQDTTDKGLRKIYILGASSFFLCLAGGLAKFTHFPGAFPLLILGSLGLTAFFFPLYVAKEFKGFTRLEPRFIFLCIGIIYFNMFNLLLAVR